MMLIEFLRIWGTKAREYIWIVLPVVIIIALILEKNTPNTDNDKK